MAMNFPDSPTTGQTFSVSGGPTYSYDGSKWRVLTPGNSFARTTITATAGQTSFSVVYTVGAIDVFQNGVKLVSGSDFTATTGTTIVLTNGANAGDTLEVVSYSQITYTAVDLTSNVTGTLPIANGGTGRTTLGTGVQTALGNTVNGASGICVQDANGNVSLGTAAYSWRSNSRAFQSSTYLALWQQSDGAVNLSFGVYEGSANTFNYKTTGDAPTLYSQLSGAHRWYTAPSGTANGTVSFTQAMTLDASGNLLVGTTSTSGATGGGIKLLMADGGAGKPRIAVSTASSSSGTFSFSTYSTDVSAYRFYVRDDGQIVSTTGNVIAVSDASLKKNIRQLETGLAEVLRLQPRRFDWINGDGNNVAGFIAQEVEPVLPDLVSDYQYTDTETKRALKMGDMIPTIVNAIQELAAKVSALEAKQ